MVRRRAPNRPRAGEPARGRCLSGGGHPPRRRTPAGLDGCGPGARSDGPSHRAACPMNATAPALAFFWGDDELSAARALDRFQADLEIAGGMPMERWSVRGDRSSAAGIVASITERV